MKRSVLFLFSVLIACFAGSKTSQAGETSQPEMTRSQLVNQANAPLSSIMQVRLRDTYIPQFTHMPGHGNLFAIDVTMPFPAYRVLPIRHLTRLTIPAVATNPDKKSGTGDLRFIDLAILHESKHFLVGVGPSMVFPSASGRKFGQGKWQLGPAGGFAITSERWLAGALVQNPMSVGGDVDRPSVNSMVLQPFVTYQLGRGWFFRSQPQLYFDWKTTQRIFPVDLGVGQTTKIGRQVISWYIQPYWNFVTGGDHPPRNGVTVGISFLYPNFWKKSHSLIR